MKISFYGDISGLEKGIAELSELLETETDDGEYRFQVKKQDTAKLSVKLDGHSGSIIYSERCHFFRALGLAVQEIREGKTQFDIAKTPQFNMSGPMFYMSQDNAAFNAKTLKSIIKQLALMGLNTLMLYCENSFEAKEQPYLGYMRARYSEEEMRDLDEYAWDLGIEMIPCIQTLAHMPDTLRWAY